MDSMRLYGKEFERHGFFLTFCFLFQRFFEIFTTQIEAWKILTLWMHKSYLDELLVVVLFL